MKDQKARSREVTAIRLKPRIKKRIGDAARAVGMSRSAFLKAAALLLIEGRSEQTD